MWIPAEPWWEPIVRAGSIYLSLMVLMRLAGKRTLSQLTPFDLLVMLLLSEAVSPSIGGNDQSIVGGIIRAATLIGRDGALFEKVLRRQRIGRDDIEKALREAQCELPDLALAVLEPDGQITVWKASELKQGEAPSTGPVAPP